MPKSCQVEDPAARMELTAQRVHHDDPVPEQFHHYQVHLPSARGVDAIAPVVDFCPTPDSLSQLPRRWKTTATRFWSSSDHGQLRISTDSQDRLREHQALLTVNEFGLVDPALFKVPGCPVVRDDSGRRSSWVEAERLDTGFWTAEHRRGMVPYSLALPRPWDLRPKEPLTHPHYLGGLGSGETLSAATAEAWAHINRDDALACWWLGAAPMEPVVPHPGIVRAFRYSGMHLSLRMLRSSWGVSVVVALVDDGHLCAIGAATGVGVTGQRAAVANALWQWCMAKELANPASTLHRHTELALPDFRPAQDYLSAAAQDGYRSLLDPLAHVQLLLDPRTRAIISQRWEDSSARALPVVPASRTEAWRVRLTTDTETEVVRLLVPEAAKLTVGAFPQDPETLRRALQRLQLEQHTPALPYPGW